MRGCPQRTNFLFLMTAKPQLGGLGLEVKIIWRVGYRWVCWLRRGRLEKSERAGGGDEFALHVGVGFAPGK